MAEAMTTRERVRAVLAFEPFDRLPVVEWAPWWTETLAAWRGQGLPAELEGGAVDAYFGLDVLERIRVRCFGPGAPQPASHGAPVISDEDEYRAMMEHHVVPEQALPPARLEALAARQATGEAAAWVQVDGFFWYPRTLFGIENHLYAFYDQPELMHRMNRDHAEFLVALFRHILAYLPLDFVALSEDMSYNHGPMLSEELFDEFLAPYYGRVVPLLREAGVTVFVDSDGQVEPMLPWMERVGVEGMLPLERQAGVDVARMRERHPRLRLLGAFDKMTMDKGEEAMRAEFERLLPVARQGGYILGCDHQTPPAVTLEDYRLYVRLFREYAEKAGS